MWYRVSGRRKALRCGVGIDAIWRRKLPNSIGRLATMWWIAPLGHVSLISCLSQVSQGLVHSRQFIRPFISFLVRTRRNQVVCQVVKIAAIKHEFQRAHAREQLWPQHDAELEPSVRGSEHRKYENNHKPFLDVYAKCGNAVGVVRYNVLPAS